MTDIELEMLKYPIGTFQKPDTFSEELKRQWINTLSELPMMLGHAIESLDNTQLQTPYRPGGWTVVQVVHHIADSHMNALVRLKLALTENVPVIKPYEESLWAELPDSKNLPVQVSVELLEGLHQRMVNLLENIRPEDWYRTYFHPGYKKEFSIWEVAGLYAWHSNHHVAQILSLKKKMNW